MLWLGGGGLLLGGGRAKGFGGPVAPADKSVVVAEGDGGGSTIPEEWEPSWRVV